MEENLAACGNTSSLDQIFGANKLGIGCPPSKVAWYVLGSLIGLVKLASTAVPVAAIERSYARSMEFYAALFLTFGLLANAVSFILIVAIPEAVLSQNGTIPVFLLGLSSSLHLFCMGWFALRAERIAPMLCQGETPHSGTSDHDHRLAHFVKHSQPFYKTVMLVSNLCVLGASIATLVIGYAIILFRLVIGFLLAGSLVVSIVHLAQLEVLKSEVRAHRFKINNVPVESQGVELALLRMRVQGYTCVVAGSAYLGLCIYGVIVGFWPWFFILILGAVETVSVWLYLVTFTRLWAYTFGRLGACKRAASHSKPRGSSLLHRGGDSVSIFYGGDSKDSGH